MCNWLDAFTRFQVSMQHTEGITANTEFEYLKNIMFQVIWVNWMKLLVVRSNAWTIFDKSFFFRLPFLQYLTNNINSNGSTLIKVIAAVLKFSPQQTQVALEKEAHRKTLVRILLKMSSDSATEFNLSSLRWVKSTIFYNKPSPGLNWATFTRNYCETQRETVENVLIRRTNDRWAQAGGK